jgi:uncharacterized protein YecE (DUF72 family)
VRGELRIGTSGYQYDHWRGVLYPTGLPKKRWLAHYARTFDTVEINNTFYRLPSRETFAAWRREAPEDFVFAVKMSRFATHMKKLMDPEATIGLFLERSAPLGETMGPILAQLPPRWHADAGRLDAFLAAAPGRHRWAIEVRDQSWLNEDVYRVLRRHRAALVIHDLIAGHPREVTASWTYLRFHGGPGGTYTSAHLASRARWIAERAREGLDVYAFFNNDRGGYAVRDAMRLRDMVLRSLTRVRSRSA